MAKWHTHFVVGGLAGLLPDIALVLFGWRKTWVPESDPLVRTHRALHTWHMALWVVVLGIVSHIALDKVTRHNQR